MTDQPVMLTVLLAAGPDAAEVSGLMHAGLAADDWEVIDVHPAPVLPTRDEGAVIGRTYLDQAQCSMPACTHTAHDQPLTLSGGCHVGAPVHAAYADGLLRVSCAVCRRFICSVRVAGQAAPARPGRLSFRPATAADDEAAEALDADT